MKHKQLLNKKLAGISAILTSTVLMGLVLDPSPIETLKTPERETVRDRTQNRSFPTLPLHRTGRSHSSTPAPSRPATQVREVLSSSFKSDPNELTKAMREPSLDQAYSSLYAVVSRTENSLKQRSALKEIATRSDLDPTLRGLALWGLARIGELEASRSSLVSGIPAETQRTAIEMLRRHGSDTDVSLLLRVATESEDLSVRESALRAGFDTDPHGAMPIVFQALSENNPLQLRLAALELLVEHPEPEALELVLSFRADRHPNRGALHQARALLSLRSVDPQRVDATLEELSYRGNLDDEVRAEIGRMRRNAVLSGWELHPCSQQGN
jgi:hypothetical protein